jgi:hypothetical protein
MCETCRVLQQKVSNLRFNSLLGHVFLKQATPDQQFEAIKQVNNAELEMRATEDLLADHQNKHL